MVLEMKRKQSPAPRAANSLLREMLVREIAWRVCTVHRRVRSFREGDAQSRAPTGDANELHLGLKAARVSPGRQEASGSGRSMPRSVRGWKSLIHNVPGGQIGPCRGHSETVGGVPAHQLFITTLWALFSLTHLNLLLGIPCGFCSRDEQKWEEV